MTQLSQGIQSLAQKIIQKNPVLHFFNSLICKNSLFSDFSNYFAGLFLKSIPISWQKLLFLAGTTTLTLSGLSIITKVLTFANTVIRHKINQAKSSAKRLKQKYGNCWVAVTGFTEGIGWAFVNELLRLDMKLILIGRNRQKIQKRVKSLQQRFPQCQLQTIVGDLSKVEQTQKICEQLKQWSKKIDIGILVNNAGLADKGQMIQKTPKSILDILETNWTSVVLLSNAMISIFKKRNNKSAIINFSSSTGRFISPVLSCYPATKRMVNVYSDFLRKQNSDKIDVMTVMPFGVITPMMKMIKDFAIITPQTCVKSVISDLLSENFKTHGGLKHKILGHIFENLSEESGARRFELFWNSH